MANKNYSEQLKDPRWQKKRLEIMDRDGFHCCYCGNSRVTLNVHHKKYTYGKSVWDYPNDNLLTLCEDCHKMVTDCSKTAVNIIQNYGMFDIPQLLNLLSVAGMLYPKDVKILTDIGYIIYEISTAICDDQIEYLISEYDSVKIDDGYDKIFNKMLVELIKKRLNVI